jgi:hypothetical protein
MNYSREGPLNGPSSSVKWVAVFAATGGRNMVRTRGMHRQQPVLGHILYTVPGQQQ